MIYGEAEMVFESFRFLRIMRKAGILLFLQCQNGRKLRITN